MTSSAAEAFLPRVLADKGGPFARLDRHRRNHGHRGSQFVRDVASGTRRKGNGAQIVDINRNLLRDLRGLYGERHPPRSDQDAEYVGIRDSGTGPDASWPGDDEMIARYLAQQTEIRTTPVATDLREAGAEVSVMAREGEDPASGIIAAAKEQKADVVVLGSHGSGLFEGLLDSTGTKLVRRSPCPVLVLRKG